MRELVLEGGKKMRLAANEAGLAFRWERQGKGCLGGGLEQCCSAVVIPVRLFPVQSTILGASDLEPKNTVNSTKYNRILSSFSRIRWFSPFRSFQDSEARSGFYFIVL
jgi:hypothetical protein